jgi:hypothetical protein
MVVDLTIGLADRPGRMAEATAALARAGINIRGACGYVCDERGIFHVLVDDVERAKRALIDASFEILAEREVILARVEDRTGAAAAVLREIAAAKVNVDLLYLTVDGQLVVGGESIRDLRAAIG